MNIVDNRDNTFTKGDIVVFDNNKKYLVVYENSCIAWHFVSLDNFEFDVEQNFDVSSDLKIGSEIEGIGKIVSVIKKENITLSLS